MAAREELLKQVCSCQEWAGFIVESPMGKFDSALVGAQWESRETWKPGDLRTVVLGHPLFLTLKEQPTGSTVSTVASAETASAASPNPIENGLKLLRPSPHWTNGRPNWVEHKMTDKPAVEAVKAGLGIFR